MIGEAQFAVEGKRKTGGVKEMLQHATKLTQRIRFLVEEVRDSPCACDVHPDNLRLGHHSFSLCTL